MARRLRAPIDGRFSSASRKGPGWATRWNCLSASPSLVGCMSECETRSGARVRRSDAAASSAKPSALDERRGRSGGWMWSHPAGGRHVGLRTRQASAPIGHVSGTPGPAPRTSMRATLRAPQTHRDESRDRNHRRNRGPLLSLIRNPAKRASTTPGRFSPAMPTACPEHWTLAADHRHPRYTILASDLLVRAKSPVRALRDLALQAGGHGFESRQLHRANLCEGPCIGWGCLRFVGGWSRSVSL